MREHENHNVFLFNCAPPSFCCDICMMLYVIDLFDDHRIIVKRMLHPHVLFPSYKRTT